MLEITPIYTFNTINNGNNLSYARYNVGNDAISFRGRVGAEKFYKKGIEILIQETGLFRDWQTLLFVKNYIEKNFAGKSLIKIISGGCSTGEEAASISILLNHLKDKVKILGIDLSESAVNSANSRKFKFQNAKDAKYVSVDDVYTALKDRFLVFGTDRTLSADEKLQKELFDKFFDITDEKVPLIEQKLTLWQKLENFLAKNFMAKYKPMFCGTKIVKLKDGEINNCTFKVGDIRDIETLTNGEKSDVIFFKNAIYHMISDDVGANTFRVIKPNGEIIAENIIKKLKNNLNENGLIVFGEEEVFQTGDKDLVPRVMKRLGFEPLNETEEHEANVWRKISL